MNLRARRQQLRAYIERMEPEKKRLIGIGAGIAAAAFLIGYAMTALTFVRAGAPIDVVTVPDVRERPVDEATRILGRSDLSLEVGDSFPNPTMPAGAVLAQAPLPGQEVSPGTMVRVIISMGQNRPTVPDVDAMALADAMRALRSAGFEVVVEEVPGGGPEGRILGTVPAAGTTVQLPARVRLRVAAAAIPIPMPTLIGMLEGPARAAAEGAGLRVEEVVYEASQFGEPGGVVGQEPAPGESVLPGSGVRLRVTSGPPASQQGADLMSSFYALAGLRQSMGVNAR